MRLGEHIVVNENISVQALKSKDNEAIYSLRINHKTRSTHRWIDVSRSDLLSWLNMAKDISLALEKGEHFKAVLSDKITCGVQVFADSYAFVKETTEKRFDKYINFDSQTWEKFLQLDLARYFAAEIFRVNEFVFFTMESAESYKAQHSLSCDVEKVTDNGEFDQEIMMDVVYACMIRLLEKGLIPSVEVKQVRKAFDDIMVKLNRPIDPDINPHSDRGIELMRKREDGVPVLEREDYAAYYNVAAKSVTETFVGSSNETEDDSGIET